MEQELQDWYQLHRFHLYSGSYETKDLANFLGVNPRTIQRWLRKKSKPTSEQIAQIRRYLNSKEEKLSL